VTRVKVVALKKNWLFLCLRLSSSPRDGGIGESRGYRSKGGKEWGAPGGGARGGKKQSSWGKGVGGAFPGA